MIPITDGPFDPKELMDIKGPRETQMYLVEEVQRVYRDQGVSIHDKHIELIVRQMTRRIAVSRDRFDTDFLPGERVDAKRFRDTNRRNGRRRRSRPSPKVGPRSWASPRPPSPPSPGSRPPPSRRRPGCSPRPPSTVAADGLIGLKENIIIGKLIPAGTGMMRYREFSVQAPDYEPMTYYSSEVEDDDPASALARIFETAAVGDASAADGD